MLSVLLLTPYLFRSLGADGFGTWSVMLTVATVFSLLEVGSRPGSRVYVAELEGSGRSERGGPRVRSGAVLMTLLGSWHSECRWPSPFSPTVSLPPSTVRRFATGSSFSASRCSCASPASPSAQG